MDSRHKSRRKCWRSFAMNMENITAPMLISTWLSMKFRLQAFERHLTRTQTKRCSYKPPRCALLHKCSVDMVALVHVVCASVWSSDGALRLFKYLDWIYELVDSKHLVNMFDGHCIYCRIRWSVYTLSWPNFIGANYIGNANSCLRYLPITIFSKLIVSSLYGWLQVFRLAIRWCRLYTVLGSPGLIKTSVITFLKRLQHFSNALPKSFISLMQHGLLFPIIFKYF